MVSAVIAMDAYLAYLHEQLGQMYVWGGNGEVMTTARIRRMEGDTGGTHMQDALALQSPSSGWQVTHIGV